MYESKNTMPVHIISKQRMDSLLKKEHCRATKYSKKYNGIIVASEKVTLLNMAKTYWDI